LAIAWVLDKGDDIVPLVGSRRTVTLTDSLKALDIRLTAEEIQRLNVAYPLGVAAGTRYAEPMMSHLDSERG
jgi:aryl-alcohol dehydrogenase-like predicted oxidoreductase